MVIVNKVKLFTSPARLDDGVFESTFYEHYPRVYAVLFRLVGDPYEADDLAAETFWRLWERPPHQDENLGGWLYRVATHMGYNALRSKRRRARYEEEAGKDALDHGSLPDPADTVEQADARRRVRDVLRKMPLRDVQILVLRHSGFSYKEIADAVGVAATSVGALLSRAEDRFEALYQQGEKDASKR